MNKVEAKERAGNLVHTLAGLLAAYQHQLNTGDQTLFNTYYNSLVDQIAAALMAAAKGED